MVRPGGLTARRNLFIAANVVLFHAAMLWALQTGLVRRVMQNQKPAYPNRAWSSFA